MDVRVKYASNLYCGSLTFLPDEEPPTVIVIPMERQVTMMVKDNDIATRLIAQFNIERLAGKSYDRDVYGGKRTISMMVFSACVSPDCAVDGLKELFKMADIKIVEEGEKPW